MSRRNSCIIVILIALIGIALDRLSKAWAVSALPLGADGANLVIARFTMVHNFGAAFGMGSGHPYFFVVVALVILAGIAAWLAFGKTHGTAEVVSLGLIAAGAVGNCIDRVADGYVTDFIEFTFIDFPVFNVADICVTCGVVLFVVCVIFFVRDDDSQEGGEA